MPGTSRLGRWLGRCDRRNLLGAVIFQRGVVERVAVPALHELAQPLVQPLPRTLAALQHTLQAVLLARRRPLATTSLGPPKDAANQLGPALTFFRLAGGV